MCVTQTRISYAKHEKQKESKEDLLKTVVSLIPPPWLVERRHLLHRPDRLHVAGHQKWDFMGTWQRWPAILWMKGPGRDRGCSKFMWHPARIVFATSEILELLRLVARLQLGKTEVNNFRLNDYIFSHSDCRFVGLGGPFGRGVPL
ncbi:hypothetical protein CEXT_442051 [Caerostris extrusa]|uniref:Uncharacterized protein n=1 Tax=Caerostris extrusa TaxID=172846 RepID=A0AAV4XXZ5_CAEEX|nr:hypothetical protein CEXT_442051 [Caerostris extrusa]